MNKAIEKMRAFYAHKPDAPVVMEEFGFYTLDRWISEGHIKKGEDLAKLFGYDGKGKHFLGQLGWCEAEFVPRFEETVLEDRGTHELVRDYAGRSVLYFKGRRSGFMPEYVDHPVKDMTTWERDVKWRMDPSDARRYADLEPRMQTARECTQQGMIICQNVIGGYMYLRSLIGPEDLLYAFYDQPELIRACMERWLELSDAVIARHQQYVTIDELYMAEDICYNNGPLISPDMMREFLFPYYQQLISNIKSRQLDKNRHLYIQIDTDGDCRPVIDVYREIGMDYMSPFEVASGCDVVEIRKQYPELLMRGGFDKRIIAAGREAIDREIDRMMPFMRAQGGFIPVCDHGVPEEVAFEDYVYFRQRLSEYGN